MTTLLEFTNRVLRQTGQQTVSTLANAETPVLQTISAINHIVEDLHLTLNSHRIVAHASVLTVGNTETITLLAPPNRILGESVYIENPHTPLAETTTLASASELREITGVPQQFYRQGNTLTLLPAPDNTYTVHYQYLTLPDVASADADMVEVPADWETALLFGAQAMLEKFLGEDGFALSYQLYRNRVEVLRAQSLRHPAPRMQGPFQGYQH